MSAATSQIIVFAKNNSRLKKVQGSRFKVQCSVFKVGGVVKKKRLKIM